MTLEEDTVELQAANAALREQNDLLEERDRLREDLQLHRLPADRARNPLRQSPPLPQLRLNSYERSIAGKPAAIMVRAVQFLWTPESSIFGFQCPGALSAICSFEQTRADAQVERGKKLVHDPMFHSATNEIKPCRWATSNISTLQWTPNRA